MSTCKVCGRALGYTCGLPILKTSKKVRGRIVVERSNGPRKDFRLGYYGHGLFCTTICAASFGLGAALEEDRTGSGDAPSPK